MALLSNGADFVPNQPWQMLFQQPHAVDMTPNPTYDQAMGYNINPGDDAGTAFGKSLQSMLSRTTPEGQNLMSDIAKTKLANQLSIQLKQQQYQLAQQYPTYQHFVATGLGTVLAMDEFGNSKMMGTENPTLVATKQAELAKLQAEGGAEAFKASPDFQKAQLSQLQSETARNNAMPGLEQARINVDQQRANLMQAQMGNIGMAKVAPPDYQKILKDSFMKYGVPLQPSQQSQLFGEDPNISQKRQQAVQEADSIYKQQNDQYQQRASRGNSATLDPTSQLQSILGGGFD
jgi:hypothetical protein